MPTILINGSLCQASDGERLVEIGRPNVSLLPRACFHARLGNIQTCDTCLVEVNDKLVRACGTRIVEGMPVQLSTAAARAARVEAFDRILSSHLLCCIRDVGKRDRSAPC
jgi:formate dehydrogenase major subunit